MKIRQFWRLHGPKHRMIISGEIGSRYFSFRWGLYGPTRIERAGSGTSWFLRIPVLSRKALRVDWWPLRWL